MAKCPKCGAEINELIAYVTNIREDIFSISKDGEAEYEVDEDFDVNDCRTLSISFGCPMCLEVLFTSEEDAKNFLLGKEVKVVEK
jgi:hypothetical protein